MKKTHIFMNSLKFTVPHNNTSYGYILSVTFFPVRIFKLFVIFQFGELDRLKTTKQ